MVFNKMKWVMAVRVFKVAIALSLVVALVGGCAAASSMTHVSSQEEPSYLPLDRLASFGRPVPGATNLQYDYVIHLKKMYGQNYDHILMVSFDANGRKGIAIMVAGGGTHGSVSGPEILYVADVPPYPKAKLLPKYEIQYDDPVIGFGFVDPNVALVRVESNKGTVLVQPHNGTYMYYFYLHEQQEPVRIHSIEFLDKHGRVLGKETITT